MKDAWQFCAMAFCLFIEGAILIGNGTWGEGLVACGFSVLPALIAADDFRENHP